MDINLEDDAGNTPLHITCINDHAEIVILLLKNGADIYAYNKNGEIPFHSAFKNRSRKVLTFFVNIGQLIDDNNDKEEDKEGDEENENNLLNAIKTVKALLKIPSIDINYQDEDGNTPLHLACINDNVDIIILLMARSANIFKTNKEGNTILHTACENNSINAFKFLIELFDIIDGNKDNEEENKDNEEEDKDNEEEDKDNEEDEKFFKE